MRKVDRNWNVMISCFVIFLIAIIIANLGFSFVEDFRSPSDENYSELSVITHTNLTFQPFQCLLAEDIPALSSVQYMPGIIFLPVS